MNKYAAAVKSYPMMFTKSSDVLYTMETKYKGKPLTLTFNKKDWGTWNIGTFSYDSNSLAGGGTDWEYVYRAGDASHNIDFCGGNHNFENLKEIKFYDGTTDKELILDKGVPVA
jgi:hypothetical protein